MKGKRGDEWGEKTFFRGKTIIIFPRYSMRDEREPWGKNCFRNGGGTEINIYLDLYTVHPCIKIKLFI